MYQYVKYLKTDFIIIIEKNYENLGLEKYDICYVGSELLRKVDEEI